MDLGELVRLVRAGESDRTIMRLLRHNRRTVAKYRLWAEAQGLLVGEPRGAGELQALLARTLPEKPPPQQTSSLERYREQIAGYRARGMECAAIRVRLEEEHRHPVSYSTVWRLVQRLEAEAAPARESFVRVEVAPGSEAQVDFGYAGWTLDPESGQARKTWVFVMLLSFSRHLYAELVYDQRVETWLLCHEHAFGCFGGVPARIVPDNLKAAIVRASFTEPVVQRSYRECAEHYGFLIDPNPPRSPHLKGKVEQGGVHYVKRNFLAGREVEPTDELNAKLRRWIVETAGQRVHGTTRQQPLAQFQQMEQANLLPLPAVPYDLAVWKEVTLHRDCHVNFERAYYSAPYRLVGERLWVRGGSRTVSLYDTNHQRVAIHDRAAAGERRTLEEHLPPEKVPGLVLTRADCQLKADTVGPMTAQLVRELLAERPLDKLRVAGRLLRLAQTYSPQRLEAACARAAHFGAADYVTVKRILQEGLDQLPLADPLAAVPAKAGGALVATPQLVDYAPPTAGRYVFVRQVSDFVSSVFGGGR